MRSYLEIRRLRHAIIRCPECITGRHLLERTIAAVYQSLQAATANVESEEYHERCENISALTVHLQRVLKNEEKFILVFDGVDNQREAPPTLLPALARLGEFVRLTIHAYIRAHTLRNCLGTQSYNRFDRPTSITSLPPPCRRPTHPFPVLHTRPIYTRPLTKTTRHLPRVPST